MKPFLPALFLLMSLHVQARSYTFRSYQMEDGLSQNCVWTVMQDHRGFVWFGTKDGLNRFDGDAFKVYRRQQGDTTSLGNNFVRALLEDSQKRFLVGTEQGFFQFDPRMERFQRIRLDKNNEDAEVTINAILEDQSGDIWLATHGQGIYRLDSKLQFKRHYYRNPAQKNSLPTAYIWALDQDSNGHIWIGTIGEGLALFDSDNEEFIRIRHDSHDGINDNTVNSIFCDRDNNVWVGTSSGGLNCYNPRTGKTRHYLNREGNEVLNIRAIQLFSEHELIMGSDNGLVLFEPETGHFTLINNDTNANNLTDKSVFCITRDREGSFWIGTYFGGVNYYSPALNRFSYYTPIPHRNSLNGNIVSDFCETENGQIWIGTNDGGISLFDPESSHFDNFSDRSQLNLKYHNVQTLMLDRDRLWIGLYAKGIDVLNVNTLRIMNYSHNASDPGSLNDNSIFTIYKTSRGEILAGTAIGVNRYNPIERRFTSINRLNNVHVKNILEDHHGALWFATNDQGIYRYMPEEDKWMIFTYDPRDTTSLSSNNVNCLYQDAKRRLWIGTEGGGLCLYNPVNDTFRVIDERHGLPNNVINAIADDVDGNLWISTNQGLVRLDPESMTVKTFGFVDDLQKIRYNYNCALRTSDNKLCFGGTNGFIIFNPREISDNRVVPPVALIGFQIFNREMVPGGPSSPLKESIGTTRKIVLRHNQSSFSFDFKTLSFISPKQNRYAYILEGFDKEWTQVENVHKAYYMNIPAGEYVFRVRGSNNDGIWNEDGISVTIRIKPPFWFSRLMIAVYIVTVITSLWWILKRHNQRIEMRNREKLERFKVRKEKETYESKIKFFTNIAHEIRTPLSLITAPLENIILSGDGTPQTKANLEIVERNTNRLLELVNQLLDFRKIEDDMFKLDFRNCDAVEIVRKVYGQYNHSARLREIEMTLECGQNQIECRLDAEAIYKIVSNLLSNAIKYARHRINITIDRKEDDLVIAVHDDGPGVDGLHKEKIFEPFFQVDNETNKTEAGSGLGLALSQSLALRHGGEIVVMSEPDKGSTFTLRIPITICHEVIPPRNSEENTSVIRTPCKAVETGTRILIVEDNKELREFMANNLGERYDVSEADDGIAALRVIERENIDIVISDIMMPGMDGLELCHRLKSDPAYSHIPLILLSAKTDTSVKIQGLESGADVYVEKPFSMAQLKAQIGSIIENRNHIRNCFINSPLQYFKQSVERNAETEFLEKLNGVILEHLTSKDFSIDSLSEQFLISRSNFHKKIKSLTGMTPNDYIKLIRLNKAAQLLLSDNYKINEVCYMVGFNTPSYFSKCFFEQFGKLPKDFAHDE